MSSRSIVNTQNRDPNKIQELLHSVAVGEFLSPSKQFWLVSPWVTNIVLVQSGLGTFRGLHDQRYSQAKLMDLLEYLARSGSQVHLVIRGNQDNPQDVDLIKNRDVIDEVRRIQDEIPDPAKLRLVVRPKLHIKGLVGDSYSIVGSMNFTYFGVSISDERITLNTAPDRVSELLLQMRGEYE